MTEKEIAEIIEQLERNELIFEELEKIFGPDLYDEVVENE